MKGKKDGKGTFRWTEEENTYTGEFRKNCLEGQGTFIWANGRKYEGQW